MNEMLDFLINQQDKALLRLQNEGLTLEEILNLEISDIDKEKQEIRLDSRTIKALLETIHDILGAYHQDVYFADNGENEEEPIELEDSIRIIKNSINETMTVDLLNNRLKMIQEHF